ncbi:MAG: LD-carboxypeptidase [Candidatus Electryoneaceae bacterium]|nr:LD-carboxypeptidase [Candidatus Electryoneaceae bacterium]
MSTLPSPLNKGDLIRVISPAGPVDLDRLKLGVRVLESWGYRVEIAPNALNRNGYLAGTDEERLSDLVSALIDPNVKGVICSRGGYGSVRLLDKMPWDFLAQQTPKVFVGFSDIGALQLALFKKTGWVSFSGPQVMALGDDVTDRTADHLHGMLDGSHQEIIWRGWQGGHAKNISGPSSATHGILCPCCLSMLVSMIGTDYFPNLSNVILCIEDINEPSYRIERMLWQLVSSNSVNNLNALVLGRFIYKGDDISEQVERIVLDRFGKLNVSIWSGLPYGHVQDRLTIPVGMEVAIDAYGRISLL